MPSRTRGPLHGHRAMIGTIPRSAYGTGPASFPVCSMFSIHPYTPTDRPAWDDFVRRSRNGVFLFERAYMDYHADRFEDASVIIRSNNGQGRIVAVLPAHRKRPADGKGSGDGASAEGDICISHGGLTFGGLVMDPKLGGEHVPALMQQLAGWLKEQGFASLHYRATPHIYHRLPSEDDLYALHRLGARVSQVLFSSTLDLERPSSASSQKNRARICSCGYR